MHKTKNFIIHHFDEDGYGAAWAASKALSQCENIFHVAKLYSDPFPKIPVNTDVIYILDFSYQKHILLPILNKFKVVLIDHHKSTIEDYGNFHHSNLTLILDSSRSGALLTFNYFNKNQDTPEIIKHINNYDLWIHDSDTARVISFLRLQQLSVERIEFLNSEIHKEFFYKESLISKQSEDNLISSLCSKAFESNINGLKCLVVNSPTRESEVCNKLLCDNPSYELAICFSYIDNKYIKYSFRSSKGRNIDVSEIARNYGGGGHKNAAGCILDYFLFKEQ